MFTTLNLTLNGQMPAESGLLPAQTTDGQPAFDATTFAASLELSLGTSGEFAEAGGSPLPLAGIELPVDAEAELLVADEASLDGMPLDTALLDDGADSAIPWPPGLEPASDEVVDDVKPTPAVSGELYALAKDNPEQPIAAVVAATAGAADEPEAPVVAAPVRAQVTSSVAERRVPVLDPLPAAGAESAESVDLEAEFSVRQPVDRGERFVMEPPAPRPAQPESASLQRLPEWTLPGSGASSSADGSALNTLANASANAASAAGQRAAAAPATPLPTISTPVGEPGFGDSVADRVLLMASNRLGNAEIRLTPAELGPVRVQVTMDDGTANIQFHAAQAATRDALEQAMPRLRELLSENGLSLGQASVSDDGSRQDVRDNAGNAGNGGDGRGEGASAAADSGDMLESDTGSQSQTARLSNALVDTFV